MTRVFPRAAERALVWLTFSGFVSEIHALLHRMADRGLALLVVSSDLPELLRLCDRIIVLSRGRLAGEVARADFDEHKILEMAYSQYLQPGVSDE